MFKAGGEAPVAKFGMVELPVLLGRLACFGVMNPEVGLSCPGECKGVPRGKVTRSGLEFGCSSLSSRLKVAPGVPVLRSGMVEVPVPAERPALIGAEGPRLDGSAGGVTRGVSAWTGVYEGSGVPESGALVGGMSGTSRLVYVEELAELV